MADNPDDDQTELGADTVAPPSQPPRSTPSARSAARQDSAPAAAAPAPTPATASAPLPAAAVPPQRTVEQDAAAPAEANQETAVARRRAAQTRKSRTLPAGFGPKAFGPQTVDGSGLHAEVSSAAAPVRQESAQAPPAAAAEVDAALLALRTPREDLRQPPPADAPPWVWAPARIGADAAQAGPNGIIKACALQAGEFTVGMCAVHMERGIMQKKNQYFIQRGEDGKLAHPEVCDS